MNRQRFKSNFERFKSIVHPQGYGFWADPDGIFTFLGSISLVIAAVIASGFSEAVAELGETWRSVMWDGPPVRVGLLLLFASVMSMMLTDPLPTDFSKTGRFHLWVAGVGAILVMGTVAIWSWPGFDYDHNAPFFDWAMRICAVTFFVLLVGRAIRSCMTERKVWIATGRKQGGASAETSLPTVEGRPSAGVSRLSEVERDD